MSLVASVVSGHRTDLVRQCQIQRSTPWAHMPRLTENQTHAYSIIDEHLDESVKQLKPIVTGSTTHVQSVREPFRAEQI